MNRAAVAWGVVFCTLGGAFLLEELGVWRVQLSVLLPLLLIAAGLALALSAVVRDREATGR